ARDADPPRRRLAHGPRRHDHGLGSHPGEPRLVSPTGREGVAEARREAGPRSVPVLVPSAARSEAGPTVGVSLVVPLHAERARLHLALEECEAVPDAATQDWSCLGIEAGEAPRWEIVFVDDGSTDGSFSRLRELAERNPRVRALRLRRHLGKAAALSV